MHPNRGFAWEDSGEMLDFVRRISFCTICAEGPAVAHAPALHTWNVLPSQRVSFGEQVSPASPPSGRCTNWTRRS